MRIRIPDENFLGFFQAVIYGSCAMIGIVAAPTMHSDFNFWAALLIGIGFAVMSAFFIRESVEIDRNAPRQDPPPKKDSEPRPEVVPVKRDRYEMIKVGVT